jgi:tryptophanyl-tRNA synthetase
MRKKMTKSEKKVKKVMREFKKGELPIGKSKKKVKNRVNKRLQLLYQRLENLNQGDKMEKLDKITEKQVQINES